MIAQQTFRQLFAPSYREYYGKIGKRGLSSLIAISDDAFARGMERFRVWADVQPPDQPVYESVDVFVFRRRRSSASQGTLPRPLDARRAAPSSE